ncbi:HD domain-containing phosphohydrolase [Desulfoluna butyratoxydans]|uniref:Signal transduction response regulator receiver domain n=1 Tax=Desulfoluna butyratoxydans TaxID=231438 RepID=A0A4V6YUC4_9BACT|nr:HD domain-containing phosphohydrolase [Desulfoluna butyratoxydans]VFQ43528.1 signal transduction response regulator receiver domain [Desulfoluna butyratoxydans]
MTERGKETILFVDDEESILDITGEYFRHKGYQVLTAGNGHQALEVLASHQVDCCFTDINMPGMDGLELAEHIRQKDVSIPVVVMTGFPSLENTLSTLKNGVVDFLIKPVKLEQMELCVNRVFRERELFLKNLLLAKEVEGKERLESLNAELVGKVEELNIMNRIMDDFSAISSSEELFKKATESAVDITGAESSRFFIVSESVDTPFEMAATGSNGARISLDGLARYGGELEALIREVALEGVPTLISHSTRLREMKAPMSSVVLVPLKIRAKSLGVLVTCHLDEARHFSEKDVYHLSFMTQKAAGNVENVALYENIYDNLFSTLSAFVKAVEARDSYTNQHSNRVAELAILLGSELGCTKEELDVLNFAGRLHDIGKIGIRDAILLKPGRLTDEEFEKIKEHPDIGADIVGQLGLWDREAQIIRHHHERFDGQGYPEGLRGVAIPFLARILSVADAFDAMASDRAYRRKMPLDKVTAIIRDGAGGQFDPRVVDAYLKVVRTGGLEGTVKKE